MNSFHLNAIRIKYIEQFRIIVDAWRIESIHPDENELYWLKEEIIDDQRKVDYHYQLFSILKSIRFYRAIFSGRQ